MGASDIEKISQTIQWLATPELKPKKLFKAVREEQPEASRKEIVWAAFLTVIIDSETNPDKAAQLQISLCRSGVARPKLKTRLRVTHLMNRAPGVGRYGR